VKICEKTPFGADSKPRRRYVAKHIDEVAGVPFLPRMFLERRSGHAGCVAVLGRVVAENTTKPDRNKDRVVVHPADRPLSATSGVAGLPGDLARERAVRVAGVADLKPSGRTRFDGEEACIGAVKNKASREGKVLVIRSKGPQCGPGKRAGLVITAPLCHQGVSGEIALRMPGALGRSRYFSSLNPSQGTEERCSARHLALTNTGAAVEKVRHANV
jgi:dihydroxy-acid dehydratase